MGNMEKYSNYKFLFEIKQIDGTIFRKVNLSALGVYFLNVLFIGNATIVRGISN